MQIRYLKKSKIKRKRKKKKKEGTEEIKKSKIKYNLMSDLYFYK